MEVKNLFSGERFPDTADVFLPEKGWHSLVKINWDDKEEQPASMVLNENWITGLMPGKCYLVAEFYSGQYQTGLYYGDMVQMGVIKPHGSAVFKIQEYDPEQPYIVGSNAHYSMGGEIEALSVKEEPVSYTHLALSVVLIIRLKKRHRSMDAADWEQSVTYYCQF